MTHERSALNEVHVDSSSDRMMEGFEAEVSEALSIVDLAYL